MTNRGFRFSCLLYGSHELLDTAIPDSGVNIVVEHRNPRRGEPFELSVRIEPTSHGQTMSAFVATLEMLTALWALSWEERHLWLIDESEDALAVLPPELLLRIAELKLVVLVMG